MNDALDDNWELVKEIGETLAKEYPGQDLFFWTAMAAFSLVPEEK